MEWRIRLFLARSATVLVSMEMSFDTVFTAFVCSARFSKSNLNVSNLKGRLDFDGHDHPSPLQGQTF